MWIADNWKDYEVIDCSKGKTGTLGRISSCSSGPQGHLGIPGGRCAAWKRMNGHYHRSKKGRRRMGIFRSANNGASITETLLFNLKPFSFKHTGLFPSKR